MKQPLKLMQKCAKFACADTLSLKIACFAINSSPRKLSVEQNLSYWNIYSNKTMQNLPPHVLTTIFRFVEEILSAKLIKVTYFPGSLLMLVITR